MDYIFNFVLNNFRIIELIVFWYPITMGLLWCVGGILYYFRIERKEPLPLPATPMVSVLIPAYNESDNLVDIVQRLNEMNYPDYEILIINDGSKDNTAQYAKALADKYERVRFIDLQENCGKANALYLGFMAAKGEYLICVDGDSYLDKDCIRYLMSHFLNPKNGERVGAVTGNPRVRNRSSLFARMQLCEYASIISLIKRTQRIWGKVMTVSGVVVAYRKSALLDCGLWDRDVITEDIGVTWKLERNFWDIRYEPNALCWMLVPETLGGIIKQRKRWAQGGQEVVIRHAGIFKSWRRKRMYPIFTEQVMSTLWVILWLLLTITEIFKLCYGVGSYIPYLWKSQYLAVICMIQFIVALKLERRYDKTIFSYMMVAAWYPVAYWIISGLVAIMAIPSTITSRKNRLARWNSPDRGIGTKTKSHLATEKALNTENQEAKIEIPDRDIDPDESPIINGKQVWWKKLLELLFISIAWLFILVYLAYCGYGYWNLAHGTEPISIWIYNTEMLRETLRLLFITGIILLIEIVFMIFWKEYNRLKFGKLNRRRFPNDVTVKQIAEFFEMQEEEIMQMQEAKYSTYENNIIPNDFKAERREQRDWEKKGDQEKKVKSRRKHKS